MLQYIYENNIINYTYMGLCTLGLLIRIIVNLVYKRLVKESDIDRLGETRNKMLNRVKKKFEACYKLKIGVNNVDIFVDKSILKHRFCGILLSTWDNAGGQVLFLNLLLVPVAAVFGAAYGCGQEQIMRAGAVGILSSAVLILVDKSINIPLKRNMLRINLLEYLENYCKVRLENPELAEQYRQEYGQMTEAYEQAGAADALLYEAKDELSRRRQAKLKKEEEKRLLAARKEEELRRAEEARKEEERRRREERRRLAAKRREEERLRLEQERAAIEARLAEMKKKVEQQQFLNENQAEAKDSEESVAKMDDKIAAANVIEHEEVKSASIDQEEALMADRAAEEEEAEYAQTVKAPIRDRQIKSAARSSKSKSSLQEDKLIEDVLREFFA